MSNAVVSNHVRACGLTKGVVVLCDSNRIPLHRLFEERCPLFLEPAAVPLRWEHDSFRLRELI